MPVKHRIHGAQKFRVDTLRRFNLDRHNASLRGDGATTLPVLARATISVPFWSGRREFKTYTGMFPRTAGASVAGPEGAITVEDGYFWR